MAVSPRRGFQSADVSPAEQLSSPSADSSRVAPASKQTASRAVTPASAADTPLPDVPSLVLPPLPPPLPLTAAAPLSSGLFGRGALAYLLPTANALPKGLSLSGPAVITGRASQCSEAAEWSLERRFAELEREVRVRDADDRQRVVLDAVMSRGNCFLFVCVFVLCAMF